MTKPSFWFFQITGWIFFYIQQYFQYYNEIKGIHEIVRWTISMLFLFCITLLLRLVYKQIYQNKIGLIFITVGIMFFSFFAAVLWDFFNTYLLVFIFEFIASWQIDSFIPLNLSLFVNRTFFLAFPIIIWSLLYFSIKFWFDLNEQKDRSEKAALLAQKAQLQMLRYQLNPHFLYNSLNSIQALVYDDPKHADMMISELSEFMRFSLQDQNKLFNPLGEEVRIVEKYLSIESTRFPERIEYLINVTHEAEKIEVMGFILQPFVENAVKHGMKTSPQKLHINIKGYVEVNKIFIEVHNSGYWVEENKGYGSSIQNVRDRLQNTYPDRHKIHIIKNPNSVYVIIEIDL